MVGRTENVRGAAEAAFDLRTFCVSNLKNRDRFRQSAFSSSALMHLATIVCLMHLRII